MIAVLTCALAVGLLAGFSCQDIIPKAESKENIALRDKIVDKLKEAGLGGLTLEIKADTKTGLVTISGEVGNSKQYNKILEIVKAVPGVKNVTSDLKFTDSDSDSGLLQDAGAGGIGGALGF